MKGSKEIRRWTRLLVQRYGKKNGKVRSCYFDSPEMEVKQETNKHLKALKDTSWKKHDVV